MAYLLCHSHNQNNQFSCSANPKLNISFVQLIFAKYHKSTMTITFDFRKNKRLKVNAYQTKKIEIHNFGSKFYYLFLSYLKTSF